MPDKQNESKFMAMLERRGIVRKAGFEDESSEMGSNGADTHTEAGLRSLLNQPSGDTDKVTPAARQPVPGMFNPVIPAEQPASAFRADADLPRPITSIQPDSPNHIVRPESMLPRPTDRKGFDLPRPVGVRKPTPFFSGSEYDDDYTSERDKPFTAQASAPAPAVSATSSVQDRPLVSPAQTASAAVNTAPTVLDKPPEPPLVVFDRSPQPSPSISAVFDRPPEPPPVEDCTEKYLDIDELYEALELVAKRTDTIYLIEEYLKSIPDSLPDDSRREIVRKIVAASGFDFNLLMGDGILRVKMLKDYAGKFAKYTDDYISERNAEVDEYEQEIMKIRRMIENRRELHKKQFFAIEAEAQRLKEILTFISG